MTTVTHQPNEYTDLTFLARLVSLIRWPARLLRKFVLGVESASTLLSTPSPRALQGAPGREADG